MRMAGLARTEPHERMLEQGEQADRRQPSQRSLGGEPCKAPGRRVGERVAARIVDRDLPACERRERAAGKAAVGCEECSGPVAGLERLAKRDRNRERRLIGGGGLNQWSACGSTLVSLGDNRAES